MRGSRPLPHTPPAHDCISPFVRIGALAAALLSVNGLHTYDRMKLLSRYWQAIACCLWLAAVVAGMTALVRYANTPGPPAAAPEIWPAQSRLAARPDRPTLVMFAHPQCPCSRASIGELALLMARVQGRADAHVIFYQPANAAPGWEQAGLRQAAEVIPGVRVGTDVDGVEARRFGAFVSGQTVLYSADGRLRFSGGITAARGHSGDNAGRAALAAILLGQRTLAAKTPVFGCFLFHSDTTTGPTANTTR